MDGAVDLALWFSYNNTWLDLDANSRVVEIYAPGEFCASSPRGHLVDRCGWQGTFARPGAVTCYF